MRISYWSSCVCSSDLGLRQGREPGYVTDKLRAGLIANGVPTERVVIGGEPEASLRAGLAMAAPGDVVYVMSSPDPEGSFWRIIEEFGKDAAGESMADRKGDWEGKSEQGRGDLEGGRIINKKKKYKKQK